MSIIIAALLGLFTLPWPAAAMVMLGELVGLMMLFERVRQHD